METALVTGAAGFIGSNLVRELLQRGFSVRGVDDFTTGRLVNLDGVMDYEAFEFFETDIRDKPAVASIVEDVEYVFHQAAVPSVPRSIDDPILTTDANCLGTVNLLVAARDAGVEKVVVASSSSVYGSGSGLPKRENMAISPESPYALSKYYSEELTLQFSQFYDLDTVALRYFNVFGPRQDPEGDYAAVIPKFIGRMLEEERPVIYGDGEQSRDFTYVENILEANILAARSDESGEVFNAACGDRITINELVDGINDILGSEIAPIYDDPRPGDVRHSQADISKIGESIGYVPRVEFREGLERTVEYFQS